MMRTPSRLCSLLCFLAISHWCALAGPLKAGPLKAGLLKAQPLEAESLKVGSLEARSLEAEPLKKDDVVSVNVFGEESLSGAFTVGPTGHLAMPLLGSIAAVGKTTDELAREIKLALEKDYIRKAQVVVAMAEQAVPPPHTVTVIGQVQQPQQVSYPAGTTLDIFTAIAAAGGLTERGDSARIELKRQSGGKIHSQSLALDDNRVFKLQDGDTLIVPSLPIFDDAKKQVFITVTGQVARPGNIKMNPDQPLDLIAVIAAAGGFTAKARPSKVVLRRMTDSGVKTFEFNLAKMQREGSDPVYMQAGDTVMVPESIF